MVDLSSYKDLYIKSVIENVSSMQSAIQVLLVNKSDANAIEELYRACHTLNSKASLMGDANISDLARKMEDLLTQIKTGKSVATDEVILFLKQSIELLSKNVSSLQNKPVSNASQPEPSFNQTKVLVIEDDTFFQKFYSTKLSEKNFNVAVASDGEEGLAKIAEFKPNIILLDIIMPKKNGFEVLEAIGKNPSNPPIIVFSSLGQEQDMAKARSLGASDYVNKSFYDFDNLLSKIQNLLKK